MKEVRAAQEEQWAVKQEIEEQIAFYDDRFRFGEEGDNNMEKKEVTFQREKLYEEIWQLSLSKVAKKYEVPYQKLKDACEEANIPLPSQSYWSNFYMGNHVPKEPLPESSCTTVIVRFSLRTISPVSSISQTQLQAYIDEKTSPQEKEKTTGHSVEQTPLHEHTDNTAVLGRKTDDDKNESIAPLCEALGFMEEEERQRVIKTAIQLQVEPSKQKIHPVLTKHKAQYAAWTKLHPRDPYAAWNRDTYRRIQSGEPPLYEKVSEDTLPRLYYILDALFYAIEELGGSVNQDLSVQIRNEHVTFTVSEVQKQTDHVLTKDELKQLERYEKDKKRYSYTSEPKFRKYDYLPTGRLTFSACRGSYVRDSDAAGLESRVGELLIGLYKESENIRIEREAKEEAKRKAEEVALQKELQRQRYNNEVDRLAALKNEAEDYQIACKIRAYVSAVESKPDLDQSQIEWIAWAKAKADWYDPTVKKEDSIFGK